MGALFEDVESFFGDIFAWFGRILAKYPVVFILISLISCLLMGFGLFNISYETKVETLYTPHKSEALNDREMLHDIFPDNTRDAFYSHQLIWPATYADIIFRVKEPKDGNILNTETIAEIQTIHSDIVDITLDEEGRGHSFTDLCAISNGSCVVDGFDILNGHMQTYGSCSNDSTYQESKRKRTSLTPKNTASLSNMIVKNNCTFAKALRLKYNLKHDTKHDKQLSILWQRKFLTKVAQLHPMTLHIDYSVSESLDIELADHMGLDATYFFLTILIMVVYASIVSAGGDWVSTRVLLGWAGIAAALLAILASFGLLSLFGLKFVDTCGVMPFLILGLGVDDMFILMAGFRQTDIRLSIPDRISETYRSSAISVTITSLTDILAFCIGIASPFQSIRNFCVFAGVAILLCYINQLTLFGGCLVLHARRVASSRHCITCLPTKPKQELIEDGKPRKVVLFCHGEKPRKSNIDESLCETLPSTYLPKLLMNIPAKVVVLSLYIVYITLAIIGATKLKTGLKLESVIPESSYLTRFLETEHVYYPENGPYVMFVVTSPVDYHDVTKQHEITRILSNALKSPLVNGNFRISWLDSFLSSSEAKAGLPLDADNFIEKLQLFVKKNKRFGNDLSFSEDNTEILYSRFYVQSLEHNTASMEANMMKTMRAFAKNSTVPIVAYSASFVLYEHYVTILKNTLLAVGIAMIGMLFIALAFIPHPISIVAVLLTMLSIVVGMCGFMYFWDLELSAITSVQIILSVGFCVDFTVHISHAFMTASGKNRNVRVGQALKKVGVPILNGALSSILGILMLAFATTYVYKTFFQTMLLVTLLGLGHALLLLPVLLSFVGPRRTGKPRIFVSSDLHTTKVLNQDGHYVIRVKPEEHDDATQTDPEWEREIQRQRELESAQSVTLMDMDSPGCENAMTAFPLLKPLTPDGSYKEPGDVFGQILSSETTDICDPAADLLQPPAMRQRRNSSTQISPLVIPAEAPTMATVATVTDSLLPQPTPDVDDHIEPQSSHDMLIELHNQYQYGRQGDSKTEDLSMHDLEVQDAQNEQVQADIRPEKDNEDNEMVEQERCLIQ